MKTFDTYGRLVVTTGSTVEVEFAAAGSVWTWNHELGLFPMLEILDTQRRGMLSDYQHVDENTVVVTHLSNRAGFIIARV